MHNNQLNLMAYINRCTKRLEDDLLTQERIKILRSVASTANKIADDLAQQQDLQIPT